MSVQAAGIDITAAFQFQIYGPTSVADGIASTGPLIVGLTPRRHVLRNPTLDRFDPTTTPTHTLFQIACICQSMTPADKGQVRYVARLEFELGPEEFKTACSSSLAGPSCTSG